MNHHYLPEPRQTLERCAVRAELRGDPMAGTAFPAARLLLVEQPGPWGRRGLRDSDFDPEVAAAVEARASAAGLRVLVVRRPGRTPPGAPRRWAVVDTMDSSEALHWGQFHDDAELLELPLDGSAGERDDDPIYLVCAHSKHDACCALRGRPVAVALAAARPGRVWECSHVGGDRFAASVLVLPAGLLYGRVLPSLVTGLVDATDAGEVVPAMLRGRVGQPPAAQAALAFAHDQLGLRGRRELSVRSSSPIAGGVATVRLAGPGGLFDVAVRVERVAAAGLTCANPRPNFYLSYRPLAVVPAAP